MKLRVRWKGPSGEVAFPDFHGDALGGVPGVRAEALRTRKPLHPHAGLGEVGDRTGGGDEGGVQGEVPWCWGSVVVFSEPKGPRHSAMDLRTRIFLSFEGVLEVVHHGASDAFRAQQREFAGVGLQPLQQLKRRHDLEPHRHPPSSSRSMDWEWCKGWDVRYFASNGSHRNATSSGVPSPKTVMPIACSK